MAIWKDLYNNGEPVSRTFIGSGDAVSTGAYFVQYDADSITATSVDIRFAFCFIDTEKFSSVKVTFIYDSKKSTETIPVSIPVSDKLVEASIYPEKFDRSVATSWTWSKTTTGNLEYYVSDKITLEKEASKDCFCIKASTVRMQFLNGNEVLYASQVTPGQWTNPTKDVDVHESNFKIAESEKSAEPVRVLNCGIEYVDSWIQEEVPYRHWKYDRFFELVDKVSHGSVYDEAGNKILDGEGISSKTFYYKIGDTGMFNLIEAKSYTKSSIDKALSEKLGEPAYRNITTWYRKLDLDTVGIENLLSANSENSKVTVKIRTQYTDKTEAVEESYDAKYDDLLFPPKALPENGENKKDWTITITKESSKRFKCSWPEASYALTEENQLTIGYCLELLRCPKEGSEFTPITGLSIEEDSQGRIWLKRTSVPEEPMLTILPADDLDTEENELGDFIDNNELKFVGPGDSTQVFLHTNEVYFNPKELIGTKVNKFGFADGNIKDEYEFRIYPYIVASSYLEEWEDGTVCSYPGTLLANDCTNSNIVNGLTGVMRVRINENTWKEGQVWVYTGTGWKEASCVYVKTDKDWKESI